WRPVPGTIRQQQDRHKSHGQTEFPFVLTRPAPWSQRGKSVNARRHQRSDALFATLFDQLCDQAGPAGLMACANPRAIVAMKAFVEKDEVAPVRVPLKKLGSAGHGPTPA